ncbi:glycoside hydrolase family 28 protein [Sphingobacterium bovistauri]|uniref:Glycoside hydrolase family 28 protein n=1 Tax=Sphingobacterium bovistauri TaxID=2781959 RepID=A0ABS7Z3G1_9SPHI|nr:glycoside hydrolase family 28 protein [Sphingobacterium bovistauri]MCA5004718.1 glycoside hydrolase family 28 protein [Sphingobacterium bovistauri]
MEQIQGTLKVFFKKMVIKNAFLFIVVFLFVNCKSERHKRLDSMLLTSADVLESKGDSIFGDTHSPYTNHRFYKPIFPNRFINISSGENIQSAIDSMAQMGGGYVVLEAGVHISKRIILKSNINLQIGQGAELVFKSEIEDFLPVVFTRNEGIELYSLGACIYANNVENIAITGKGKIIGPGEGSVRRKTMTHEVIEKIVDYTKAVEDRIYDGRTEDFIFPPALIAPINCKNVLIEGVSLERSAFWNVVPTYCENVIIRGLTINSVGIQRGDGIDIESSIDVLIEYCVFNTGDDCIALKAGRGYDGLRVNRPTENVIVRHCLAKQGHGGLTIGSETAGMVRNVYVHDCVFDGVDVGIRFKTRRPRGGGGENMLFENIRMRVNHSAIRWDMLGQAMHVGKLADRNYKVIPDRLTPKFQNIRIKNVVIENAEDCIKIQALPESPLMNVIIQDVIAKGKNWLSASDVVGLELSNVELSVENNAIDTVNVSGLKLSNISQHNNL